MGKKHSLLVSPKPPAHLDCMGEVVSLSEFCQKVHINKRFPLMRGVIDPVSNQVACESGEALTLSLRCHEGNDRYCKGAEAGCTELKSIFAFGLDLTHSSMLIDRGDQLLNCYFSKKSETDESLMILPLLDQVHTL